MWFHFSPHGFQLYLKSKHSHCQRYVVSFSQISQAEDSWSVHAMMLILSHIQHIWSRQLWNHWGKTLENLNKWGYIYWKKLKTLWIKEELLIMINFTIRLNVFNWVIMKNNTFIDIYFAYYCKSFCCSFVIRMKGLNNNNVYHNVWSFFSKQFGPRSDCTFLLISII